MDEKNQIYHSTIDELEIIIELLNKELNTNVD